MLKGEAGADVFVFAVGAGFDKVRGYNAAEDSLRFEGLTADDLTLSAHRYGTLIEYGNGDSVLVVNKFSLDAEDFTYV